MPTAGCTCFPTTPKPGLDVYSCSRAVRYVVTSKRMLIPLKNRQLMDLTSRRQLIVLHADGIRVFIEAGPRASCTRMIDQILNGSNPIWPWPPTGAARMR
jgi:hypothetical protein